MRVAPNSAPPADCRVIALADVRRARRHGGTPAAWWRGLARLGTRLFRRRQAAPHGARRAGALVCEMHRRA
jgi:hypothetical protein